MLLVPYACGAFIGGGLGIGDLLGLAAVLLLFVSRPPIMLLIKRKRIEGSYGEAAGSLLAGFLVPAILSAAIFLWLILACDLWWLLAPGFLGLLLFGLHQRLISGRHERTASAELVGIMMLTLTAPIAWIIATGTMGTDAWILYLLNALYFGVSVFYVKMRIRMPKRGSAMHNVHERLNRSRSVIIYLVLMLTSVVIISASGLAPALTPLAYIPMAIYLVWNILSSHSVRRISTEGLLQTALSALFAILLILFYLV